MRFLLLGLLSSCPCMAGLDEALTAFSARLPQVHETASFEAGKISPSWKPARLYTPPAGGVSLLGQFKSGDELSLRIAGLPAHDRLLICLDLVILCHWDGVWEAYGPDTWKASVMGGPTLLETTFSNFSRVGQNYPDETGFSAFPFQTAASSVGDLRFADELGADKGGWENLDATYRIWMAASHSDPGVVLRFSGKFHDDPDKIDDWGDAGENWALKGCRVWAVPAGALPDPKSRRLAAESLLSAPGKTPDPAAHAVLVLSGAEAFPEITESLRKGGLAGLIPGDAKAARIPGNRDAVIAALGSEEFKVREKASRDLAALLPEHRGYLLGIAATHEDPEVNLRIRRAIRDFDRAASPEGVAAPTPESLVPPRLLRYLRLISAADRKTWELGKP